MEAPNYQLFVYGSLRQGFNHAAYEYITKYFNLLGKGKAKGRLCDLGEYPAAVSCEEHFEIIGELYEIINEDEFDYAIAQLDDYEGVDASYDQTALYERAVTEVLLDNGSSTQANIYWYTGEVAGKPVVESGDVLQYIQSKNTG